MDIFFILPFSATREGCICKIRCRQRK